MIAELLPEVVRSYEAFGDPVHAHLLPEEAPFVERAAAERRAEFASTRWCARQALAQLGHPPAAIPVGHKGMPRWPDGIAGSLTHTAGYRAAAVARTTDVLSVGIDAEPHGALPQGVEAIIASADERRHLTTLQKARPTIHWDTLLFCAKESTYKAWFPLAQRWLGFQDATVTFDLDSDAFTTVVLVPGPWVAGRPLTSFSGRWSARDGMALTAVSVLR